MQRCASLYSITSRRSSGGAASSTPYQPYRSAQHIKWHSGVDKNCMWTSTCSQHADPADSILLKISPILPRIAHTARNMPDKHCVPFKMVADDEGGHVPRHPFHLRQAAPGTTLMPVTRTHRPEAEQRASQNPAPIQCFFFRCACWPELQCNAFARTLPTQERTDPVLGSIQPGYTTSRVIPRLCSPHAAAAAML